MPAETATNGIERARLVRFVLNGLVASAVHAGVLYVLYEVAHLPSAAVCSLVAACAGITASFIGNRTFVFDASDHPVLDQVVRFGGLYASIALLHTALLWWWTDLQGFDYRIGFVLALGLQVVLSFLGNSKFVFTR